MSERDEKREGKVEGKEKKFEDNLIEIPGEGWFDPEFGMESEGEDKESSPNSDSQEDKEVALDDQEPPQSRLKNNKQKHLSSWGRIITLELDNRDKLFDKDNKPLEYERKTGLWYYDHHYYDLAHFTRIRTDFRTLWLGLDQARAGLDFIWGKQMYPKIVTQYGESHIKGRSLLDRVEIWTEIWNERLEYDYVAEENMGVNFMPGRMSVERGEGERDEKYGTQKKRWNRWLQETRDEDMLVALGVWLDDSLLGKLPPSVETVREIKRRFEEGQNEPSEQKLARAEEVKNRELLKLEEGRSIRDSVLGGRDPVKEKGLGGYVDTYDPYEITDWDLGFIRGMEFAWKDILTLKKWPRRMSFLSLQRTVERVYMTINMDYMREIRWRGQQSPERHPGDDIPYYSLLEEDLEEQRKFEEEMDRKEAELESEWQKGVAEVERREEQRREKEEKKGQERMDRAQEEKKKSWRGNRNWDKKGGR